MSLKNKLALLKAKVESRNPKVAARPKVNKFAKLQRLAEEDLPQFGEDMSEALGEVSEAFLSLAEAADALRDNLDLGEDAKEQDAEVEEDHEVERSEKAASRRSASRKDQRKRFASSLRRIAMEAPGSLADALQEVYSTLDSVAEGIENLAGNLGIELQAEPIADDLGGEPPIEDGLDSGLDAPAGDLDSGLNSPVEDHEDEPPMDAPESFDRAASRRRPFRPSPKKAAPQSRRTK